MNVYIFVSIEFSLRIDGRSLQYQCIIPYRLKPVAVSADSWSYSVTVFSPSV